MTLDDDPRWYQKAVIYQVHVRAFFDSNRDGIGDLPGLIAKLPYLQELGIDTIWLLPFYPSPLRDGGYDIADYTSVHPDYGSMRDFRNFVLAAHDLGMRVITELVLNHTSDQHPWFQKARTAKRDSRWRNYYVWSDTPNKYAEARVIFKDFETSNWTWDPVAKQYYWHRFYSHQPDLNWENPEVEKQMFKVVDFWLSAGVDGLRLDAVPYLFEREGTICENLPETHDALKRLRSYVDKKYPNRMLLAEANQWPEDAAAYFGPSGDECQMNFHFPLMPRLYLATETEDRFPVIDILEQTPQIPESGRWAIFLRNHDELTLEMVSDVERDHLWRAFAADPRARINLGIRRRLAPLLDNDRRRIELLNGLLFALEGTPIVYYGDEIGMGDNIYLGDRDGVRTPMQWTADRNAGFSEANPHQLYLPVNVDPQYRYEAINVEAQHRNPNSLYWWMRRMITLRGRSTALTVGSLEFVRCGNAKILAFVRRHPEQAVLVVANLSNSVQYAEVDLAAFEGQRPREVFSASRFPRIGRHAYPLTLGPYSFYWFDLGRPHDAARDQAAAGDLPSIRFDGSSADLLRGRGKDRLERILPQVLPSQRWFGGRGREIVDTTIVDGMRLDDAVLAIVEVRIEGGPSETYCVPLAVIEKPEAQTYLEQRRRHVFALVRRRDPEKDAIVVDALEVPEIRRQLALAIFNRKRLAAANGVVEFDRTGDFPLIGKELDTTSDSRLVGADQSNTSIVYSERALLKLFRRATPGLNPEVEVCTHLTDHTHFREFPEVGGALNYRKKSGELITLAALQRFVPNQGDGLSVTGEELDRHFLRMLTAEPSELPATEAQILGTFLPLIEDLGSVTAKLHAAMAHPAEDPAFHPEPFAPFDQRGFYQSLRSLATRVLHTLSDVPMDGLSADFVAMRDAILQRRPAIISMFQRVLAQPITGKRIRCHGDYHLGQVLRAGARWLIIDFEGEPIRSVGERRLKRSGLKDVAGMLRSFDYVTSLALERQVEAGIVRSDSRELAELVGHARAWRDAAGAVFLASYFAASVGAGHLPDTEEQRKMLFEVHLLEKALYEVSYELSHRPRLAFVPAPAILDLLSRTDMLAETTTARKLEPRVGTDSAH